MNIEHRTAPIEHWIVDGKAYRLATEQDAGKFCLRSDTCIGEAVKYGHFELTSFEPEKEKPYIFGIEWRFAYVQDDSLLTPQRTPVPALGDGWYLLTAEDGEFKEGDKISSDGNSRHWVPKSWPTHIKIGDWLRHDSECRAARYFGPTDDTEIKPGPTEEPATKPIDWTKPVRTKDGRAVRVLCTDGPGEYPVVGLVDGMDAPRTWTISGQYFIDGPDHENDLENAPQRIQREYWVNVYKGVETLLWYDTKKKADESGGQRFACVKITIDCEEGEGL